MKYEDFINKVQYLPVIDSEILLSGVSNPGAIKVQISRWQKAGKLIQLRRGIYLLSEPYRKTKIFGSYIASVLKTPSYISLEKALEFHGLIPEAVHVYTCVTTKRPGKFDNPVGMFEYRHVQVPLFWGYDSIQHEGQTAFMATPEKALLDYFYLNHIDVSAEFLEEFRLQNVERINIERLSEYAKRFDKPGILRSARAVVDYIESYKSGEKVL